MDFADVMRRWEDDPSPGRTEQLRDAIQSAGNYSSALELTSSVMPLLANGAHAEARDVVLAAMPGAFLSPGAHTALARSHLGLGEEQEAARQSALSRAALACILRSGDGTAESPWTVLRVTDGYDVIAAMGTRVTEHAVVRSGNRFLDQLTTEGADAQWFELRNGGRRLGDDT